MRAILRRQSNAEFRLAEVESVDFAHRSVQTSTGEVGYDYLILAIGGTTNFFGLDTVVENGYPLKDIADATSIRDQLLRCFELAVQEPDPEHRRVRTHFESAIALNEKSDFATTATNST